jgi:hypothetical protein
VKRRIRKIVAWIWEGLKPAHDFENSLELHPCINCPTCGHNL